MNGVSGDRDKVGDVFVAIVEVVGDFACGWLENKGARGDRLGWIPNIGLIEGVVCPVELLDAEVVVIDEALERFYAILHRAHFDTAAHAIKGHGDHGVTGLPADGAVFGIVGDRPHTGLGLDEGLVSVSVILWREVVDGGILVEVVGGVGFAFGDGTVSDIIVGIRSVIRGDQLIADVVAVRLAILRGATAEKVVGVNVGGIGGVGDGGEEVAVEFIRPCDNGFIEGDDADFIYFVLLLLYLLF